MKHLVIVGAGGFGREMFGAAREAIGFGNEFDIKGFLDAKPTALDGFAGYPPIVGSPDSYVPAADDVFITALGSIASRRRCVAALEKKGAKFISIIHKTATIGPNVVVGEGSFIAPHVSLTARYRSRRLLARLRAVLGWRRREGRGRGCCLPWLGRRAAPQDRRRCRSGCGFGRFCRCRSWRHCARQSRYAAQVILALRLLDIFHLSGN